MYLPKKDQLQKVNSFLKGMKFILEENRQIDGKKTVISMITYLIANMIGMVVSLVALPILTNLLSTSDMGIATSFITLKNIVTLILLLSMYISIDKIFVTLKEEEDRYKFLSSIYIFSTISAIVIYAIYFIFRDLLNPILGFDTKFMTLMFVMCLLINGCTLMNSYWNFCNKAKNTFIYNLLVSPVSQILSIILVYVLATNKYLGRIIGVDFFNIVLGFGCGILILVRGKFTIKKEYVKESLQISLPMIPHLLAQVFLSSCDLLMIKNIVGESEAGIYSVAYTIANILYTISLQIFKPWSPWVYRRIENKETDSIKENSKIVMHVVWILCIGLFTLAPELIKLFINAEYVEASVIVAPICLGIFFQMMYIFFYDVEYFHKKNIQIAVFSIVTAVINIILNAIAIKIWGYQAAAYTTIISYFILCILHYFGMRKVDKTKYYDIKTLIILSLSLTIITIVNVVFNKIFILRYAILVVCGIYILIKYREMIFSILKKIFKKK